MADEFLEDFLNEEDLFDPFDPFEQANLGPEFDLGFIPIEENSEGSDINPENAADNLLSNSGTSENLDLSDLPLKATDGLDNSTAPLRRRRGRPSHKLTAEQRKEKKMATNRKAAKKYRQKMATQFKNKKNSLQYLTKKNKALKATVEQLKKETQIYKLSLNIV